MTIPHVYQFSVSNLAEVMDIMYSSTNVNEFILKLNEPLKISEREYEEILGIYNTKNRMNNNEFTIDQIVYDMENGFIFKIEFMYKKENKELHIYEIKAWHEKKS